MFPNYRRNRFGKIIRVYPYRVQDWWYKGKSKKNNAKKFTIILTPQEHRILQLESQLLRFPIQWMVLQMFDWERRQAEPLEIPPEISLDFKRQMVRELEREPGAPRRQQREKQTQIRVRYCDLKIVNDHCKQLKISKGARVRQYIHAIWWVRQHEPEKEFTSARSILIAYRKFYKRLSHHFVNDPNRIKLIERQLKRLKQKIKGDGFEYYNLWSEQEMLLEASRGWRELMELEGPNLYLQYALDQYRKSSLPIIDGRFIFNQSDTRIDQNDSILARTCGTLEPCGIDNEVVLPKLDLWIYQFIRCKKQQRQPEKKGTVKENEQH